MAKRRTYVEITSLDHGHGGPGWELGHCLWSPRRNKVGADRYAIMRQPRAGDLILHFVYDRWPDEGSETRYCARSIVARPAREIAEEPPSAGNWSGMSPYYRVELSGYTPLPRPIALSTIIEEYGDEILVDLRENRPSHAPFVIYKDAVRTGQGLYLARCSPALESILERAAGIEAAVAEVAKVADAGAASEPITEHREFRESRRLAQERYFFARNPRLVEEAKRLHGTRCVACGFAFADRYGDLGDGYIEAHHLDPLSERPEGAWTQELTTRVERIAVLCANCHRMIHRRRPALTLAELVSSIRRT